MSEPDLTGQTILITGGNSGIGKAAATQLAALGARVIITARDVGRGEQAVAEIQRGSGGRAEMRSLDLARLGSVAEFATAFRAETERLDVLILNAGIMSTQRRTTQDGFELMFQVNHLGHFLLTRLLQPLLTAGAPSRVVVVASVAHKRGRIDFDDLQSEQRYAGMSAYATSKLANVLFAAELARRLQGTRVTANSLHPGTVRTGWGADGDATGLLDVGLRLARWAFLSPEQGARTVVHLAASPEVAGSTGGYYVRSRLRQPAPQGRDAAAARRLWEVSEQLVAPWT